MGLAADGLLKSPLKLIGAKTGIEKDSARRRIYDLIPPGTTTYIEPFLGSGGILIGKKRHEIEHVNDLSVWPIHFFRTLQLDPEGVYRGSMALASTMTKDWFNALRFDPPNRESQPVAAAAWYYVINKWARNGIVRFRKKDGQCNSSYCDEDDGRGIWDEKWLQAVCERIKGVSFHNLHYRNFLAQFLLTADAETFVILDPPYSRVFTAYNGGDRFSDDDHREMAEILKEARFRWLLTINDNEFIRELYSSWAFVIENPIRWQCSNTVKGRRIETELMFANYPIARDSQLKLFA